MTTEIERYEPRAEVDSWSAVMPDVIKLADYICKTEFVPEVLRNRPAAVAAAILSGREMGIGPMRALAHVHMIEGRPSLSAEQKRAAALAAGHEIVYVETSTQRCVVKGRRKGSDEWSTVTWTMDDAKNAKDKKGSPLSGKANWRNYPRRMLQARATGELVDMLFPDASAGLATTEELVDDTDAAGITTDGETAPKKRTAKRATAVQVAPAAEPKPEPTPEPSGPPLPGEDGYDQFAASQPAANDAGTVTKDQLIKLGACFTNLGWTARDDRLRAASTIVGRKISSSKELDIDEASALIDTLETCLQHDDPPLALLDLLNAVEKDVVDAELVEEAGG